jgi:hypothetical protein
MGSLRVFHVGLLVRETDQSGPFRPKALIARQLWDKTCRNLIISGDTDARALLTHCETSDSVSPSDSSSKQIELRIRTRRLHFLRFVF